MDIRKPKNRLAAAIAAANEFKSMLDMQPADQVFWPIKDGKLFESACYAEACSLLQQAVAQDMQGAQGVGFEREITLPVPSVVTDQGADVPAQHLQLFASVTAAIAQLALEILDESGGGTKHGGFLEIGIRFRGQVDQVGELVESKGNAIHGSASADVVEQPLCHNAISSGEVR